MLVGTVGAANCHYGRYSFRMSWHDIQLAFLGTTSAGARQERVLLTSNAQMILLEEEQVIVAFH